MFLSHDEATGQLKLIITDYWAGMHERTAFTVVNSDGRPLRQRADLDGTIVHGRAGDFHIAGPHGARIPVHTMAGETSETERTPCPKATNRRRKCSLCV
jgi:hypothetical protein